MYLRYTKEEVFYLASFYSYFTFISVLSIPINHEPTQEDILLYSLKLLAENQTDDIKSNSNSYGSIFHPENDLNFYLYTKNSINKYEELTPGSVETIKNSKFNFSLPTIIAVHGWLSSGSADFCGKIKDAYLNSEDVNVITISWPAFRPYTLARLIVKPVAKNLAKFLDFLVADVGVNKSAIHLMGHSLGAHIAGIAGQNMKNGPLLWITGFDPAGPLFKFSDTDGRLDPSDAEFVDVIHTSAGYLGFSQQVGHLDFYPNGGTPVQPGCGFDLGICSHSRSYDYYIESLTNKTPFLAVPCDSYKNFASGQCCKGVTNMGYNVDRSAKGKYYLLTNSVAPFALGRRSISNPCWNKARSAS